MAYDKVVDSTQLDADLTSVANAIRTKGGTTPQLAFPSGFVSAIGDIPSGGGGGTDFTAEWQRPSDWPALPNDIGTYSGQYFLFKKISGKTIYRVRAGTSTTIQIGVTDSSGNFTALLTQTGGEIDISGLQIGNYFWVKGAGIYLFMKQAGYPEYFKEPVLESIVSNTNMLFYEGSDGIPINQETVHFLANKWTHTYVYSFEHSQYPMCRLQCVEFYGGSWSNLVTLPFNCNKIVIDGVDIELASGGKIYSDSGVIGGRGASVHQSVSYGTISLNSRTALRLNMCGAKTAEVQSFLDKLGDLSTVTDLSNFANGMFNVTAIDFTGLKLQSVNRITNAFTGCTDLETITWGESDCSGVTTLNAMFDGDVSIKSISIPGTAIHITDNNGMYLLFRNCKNAETIDLSNVDFTSNVTFNQTFGYCTALKNVTFKQNAGIANNIEFPNSNDLTVASMLSLFNALATVTAARTCKVGSTNLAKLSAAEKAIATDKGWTLS